MVFKNKRRPATREYTSNQLDSELVIRTLESCRKARTIDEIAELMEVSRVTIYNWLLGKNVPYRKERFAFIRLCEACKLKGLVAEWNGMK